MKISFELSDYDSFSVDPSGTITIIPKKWEPKPIAKLPVDIVPTSNQHVFPVAPFSVTGKATWFGLNPDGSDDKGDVDKQGNDLKGAFGDETHNKTIIGISIPIPMFNATIGKGLLVYDDVRKHRWVFDVVCHKTGKHATDVWLVDLGPNASLNRTADMTYGLATMLGITDDAIVTWWCTDTKTGKVLEIKGYDFINEKVMLS